MTQNDILRRLRFAFDFSDGAIVSLFGLAGVVVTRAQVVDWLRRDEDPALQPLSDELLAAFLNGFISHKRGQQASSPPVAEKRLNNNIILRKLKIALNLQENDLLDLMELAGMPLGKSELSALFRKPEHRHYRECKDQLLRRFLQGLQLKYGSGSAPAMP
jgi:uncharacterized protein YehS (DUF1456 family)